MNDLLRQSRRDVMGLLWLALAIFVGLALYSYHPGDPSFNSWGTNFVAQNLCGFIGSFLSDALLQSFGVAAWLWVLTLLFLSYESFFHGQKNVPKVQFLWSLSLVVIVSCLLALYWPNAQAIGVSLGGAVGLLVVSTLKKAFNFLGVSVLLWAMVLILTVFYAKRSISELTSLFYSRVTSAGRFFKSLRFDLLTWYLWVQPKRAFFKLRLLLSKLFKLFKLPKLPKRVVPRVRSEQKRDINLFPLKERESFLRSESSRFIPLSKKSVVNEFGQGAGAQSDSLNQRNLQNTLSLATEGNASPSLPMKENRKAACSKNLQKEVQWELPKISLLEEPPLSKVGVNEKEIKKRAQLLIEKLKQFSVFGEVIEVKVGPAVTLFEFKPRVNVKISKITELADDLSLALSSESVRIIAPIPGRDVVGIETSNSIRETVYLKDILSEQDFWEEDIKLPIVLGRQTDGSAHVVDLRKMPHMMVAGSTGSGKSVFIVSMLTSLLFRHCPKTLRLILIDPKQVDLAAFQDLPHLLMPLVRDTKKAFGSLKWAILEMEKRYRSMSQFGARNIESFNKKVEGFGLAEIEKHKKSHEEMGGQIHACSYYFEPQPYVVIVVEEFGDLMAVDKSNVEQAVVRLAQMARASGIHLILAMQSPRKDVVTGLIKTNIPGRVSFKVASKMDSRIILDESGAERLLAKGDMLYVSPGISKPFRHMGPWLSDEEISNVIKFWSDQGRPIYDDRAMKALDGSGGGFDLSTHEDDEYDERYDEILAYTATVKEVSVSLIQRKFRLGYPRAARIIEVFESEGLVGPSRGSKPREVLIKEIR